jgi:hypothetical protein
MWNALPDSIHCSLFLLNDTKQRETERVRKRFTTRLLTLWLLLKQAQIKRENVQWKEEQKQMCEQQERMNIEKVEAWTTCTGESEKVEGWSVEEEKEMNFENWYSRSSERQEDKVVWSVVTRGSRELNKSNIAEQLESIGFDQNGA